MDKKKRTQFKKKAKQKHIEQVGKKHFKQL